MELFRNLWRRKLRSTLTIMGIFMGIVALTTMGALAEHFNSLLDGGARFYGGNIAVSDANGTGELGSGFMQLAKADEIAKVDGVASVSANVAALLKPGDAGAVSFGIPEFIQSYDTNAQRGTFKVDYASGRAPEKNGEVLLGSSLAIEFNRKVGDRIDLPVRPAKARPGFVNHTFTVVGVLNKTLTAPDSGALITLHDAQTMMGDSLPVALKQVIDPYQIAQGMTVYGKPGVNLDNISDRINAQVPSVKANKPSVMVQSFKSSGAVFTAITTVAALLALVIGGLSVVNTMLMAVTERVREIGLKKAIGARTGNIVREFVAESTVIGLVGGALGFGAGAGLTFLLGNAAGPGGLFVITPRLALLSLGFAVVLGAAAGVLPAYRASRLDPVVADGPWAE